MEEKAGFGPNPELKLMDLVREVLCHHHCAYRTEQTYCDWIKRCLKYHYRKHPRDGVAVCFSGEAPFRGSAERFYPPDL